MKNNLELWSAVEKTDPNHTKKANVKGNKITSIKPQYQILQATKQWGSYGSTWGFKDVSLGYELTGVGLVTFKATFYYPSGEFETINTISIYKDNAQTKVDDDLAKKVETDTLTKSLSKLGFSADIFLGRYDDVRYVAEVTKEFTQKPTLTEDKFSGYKDWTDAQIQSVKKNYKLTEEQLIKLNK
tara:strand:- start:443 stop:997 length:555 start_codon:yes stop_codon:yes gene_type:complete